MKRYGQSGWYGDSYRHYLSAKGIATYRSARRYDVNLGWLPKVTLKVAEEIPRVAPAGERVLLKTGDLMIAKSLLPVEKSLGALGKTTKAVEAVGRAESVLPPLQKGLSLSTVDMSRGVEGAATKLKTLSSLERADYLQKVELLKAPRSVWSADTLAGRQIAMEDELAKLARTEPLVPKSIGTAGGRLVPINEYSVWGMLKNPKAYNRLQEAAGLAPDGPAMNTIREISRTAAMEGRLPVKAEYLRMAADMDAEIAAKRGVLFAGDRSQNVLRWAGALERGFVSGGRTTWKGLSPFKKTLVVGGGVTGGAVFGGSLLTGHGIPGLRTSMDPFETGFWGGNGAGTVPSTGGGGEGGNRVIRNFDENGDYVYDDINGNGQRDSNEPMWAKGDLSAGKTGKSGFPWGAMGAAAVGVGALALALAMSKSGDEEERRRRQQAELEAQAATQQAQAYREYAMRAQRKQELQQELANLG